MRNTNGQVLTSDVAARVVQAATPRNVSDGPGQKTVSELCGRRHRGKGKAEAAKAESVRLSKLEKHRGNA